MSGLTNIDTQGSAQNVGTVAISGLFDANTANIDNTISANAMNVAGTSDIGADVTTTAAQTFGGAVTFSGGNRSLVSAGLDFNSTIDGGANNISLNADSGFNRCAWSDYQREQVNHCEQQRCDIP